MSEPSGKQRRNGREGDQEDSLGFSEQRTLQDYVLRAKKEPLR
jgi:hypothetical protein